MCFATHFLIFLGLLLLIFGNLEEDVLQGGLRKLVVFKIQLPFACIRKKLKFTNLNKCDTLTYISARQ